MKKLFISLFTILFTVYNVYSNNSDIQFNNLTHKDGLANDYVRCFYQDSYGFMWFGTYEGLNRYDGNEFIKYPLHKDISSYIYDKEIKSIIERSDRKILVASSDGISVYSRITNSFSTLVREVGVVCLLEGTDKSILYACDQGLFRIDQNFVINKVLDLSAFNDLNGKLNKIKKVINYNHNKLLIAVNNVGIFIYDVATKKNKKIISLKMDISSIISSSDNKIWVGTSNEGIYIYDNNGQFLKKLSISTSKNSLSSNLVLAIQENDKKEVWIATENGGVDIYDINKSTVVNVTIYSLDNKKINARSIKSLYFNDGTMWVGTAWYGALFTQQSTGFYTYTKNESSKSISMNRVASLMIDSKDKLYVGLDGKGFNIISNEGFIVETIEKDLNIISMCELNENEILFGAYMHGLNIFNKKTHKVTRIEFEEDNIWGLTRISPTKIFACGNNVYLLNSKLEVIKTYYPKGGAHILDVHYLKNSYYFSGYSRVFRLNSLSDTLHRIELGCGWIFDMEKRSDNTLWMGTSRGLAVFNTLTKEFDYLNPTNKNYKVRSLIIDNNRNLWMGTSKGISCYNVLTDKIINFSNNYGIVDNDFQKRSVVKDKNGNIFFGGKNGLLTFNPDNVINDNTIRKTIFTEFVILSKNKRHKILSTKSICDIETIVLDYDQSSFRIKFVSPNCQASKKLTYYYKLEPTQDTWTRSFENIITFNSLSSGNYILRVKVENSNTDCESVLKIKIKSPWWKSIWFYILIAFILSLIGYSIIVYNIRADRRRLLEQNKKLMYEKLLTVDKQKFRFFTNVSHEIRTPLSLIISPVEKMKKHKQSVSDSDLNIIFENVDRLNRLVDSVLNFQKIEFGINKLQSSKGNIVAFVKSNILQFKTLADDKDITIEFDCSLDYINLWFDKYKMGIILYNLLSNAVKYSNKNGVISVSIERFVSSVKIQVKDTGIGISEKSINKIFDRFYQSNTSLGGSGVGLSIVKSYIEDQSATIKVSSYLGRGSVFVISFPSGDDHLSESQKLIQSTEHSSKEESLAIPVSNDTVEKNEIDKNHKTILIVEDELSLRKYLAKSLLPFFNVLIVKNGAEALEIIKTDSISLVLSDVMMPVMDGLELCRVMKNDLQTSHIPIVLLSAKVQKESISKGYKIGADAYVTKPFDLNILINVISNLISTREKLKDRFLKELNLTYEDITYSYSDENFLKKALNLIEDNIANVDFGVISFVEGMNSGRSVTYRKIKDITGLTINDFISSIRIKKAAAMLIHTKKTINEISLETGYASSQYFSTIFKKQFNLTPSQYRKNNFLL